MVQPQFRNQTYGEATAQEKRVQAMPTGNAPTEVAAQQAARRARPMPSGSLTAPTARPMEPITAGANFGAGPNALGAGIPIMPPNTDDVMEELKALLLTNYNDDLADLIDSALREGF